MVLAIGLGGRRRHRGGGEHPPPSRGGQDAGAGVRCRARARSSVRSSPMTITLAAVYAPIGFHRRPDRRAVPRVRLHAGGRGDRVRRGRADAVADDVLGAASKHAGAGPVRRGSSTGSSARSTRWYGRAARPLARLSPDHRSVRADDPRAGRLPLYAHGARSWRPKRTRASCSRCVKAPKYANIDYIDVYRRRARQGLASVPGDRPALRRQRHRRRAERHRRHAAEAVGRARAHARSSCSRWCRPSSTRSTACSAFAFNLPPLPGATGGLPVQMVINSTAGFRARLRADGEAQGRGAQERPVHRRRQRPRLQPAGGRRCSIDRSKASDLGINMAQIGDTLATAARRQLRQPLQSRRPLLPGDPAGAARHAAVPGIARRSYYVRDQHRRQLVPLSTVGVDRDQRPSPTR